MLGDLHPSILLALAPWHQDRYSPSLHSLVLDGSGGGVAVTR